MVEAIANKGRVNIFASPGTGKTSATLTALDVLSLTGSGDVWPVLVVAPLRVANSVWHAEVERWSRFKDITVSHILGSAHERAQGLKADAQIYIINYENLIWLHNMLDGKWPFKTVVCDESTAIKNHRVHFRQLSKGRWALYPMGSAQNAKSLVRYAPYTDRWINLTGTPVPNGLKDLWGQMWPVDFGESLGRTFTAFSQRWFRLAWGSTKEQQRLEILPGADEQILDRIKPHSVSIDAYDWFDINKPVVTDIPIELPPKARRIYQELHAESIVELEGKNTVTAVNAGSTTMKCRQIASGHLRDDDGTWHTIHADKLRALHELHESLSGQPLLVAYYFKQDAVAITKRFKNAVVFPSGEGQKEVENRWNRGEIPMLLVHPMSAGHGLNLQWGGNHICIYTPDWNAEGYEQVIERIGPTRQAQAGFKRLVYIHRFRTLRTWEAIVLDRLSGKIKVTEILKEALSML